MKTHWLWWDALVQPIHIVLARSSPPIKNVLMLRPERRKVGAGRAFTIASPTMTHTVLSPKG